MDQLAGRAGNMFPGKTTSKLGIYSARVWANAGARSGGSAKLYPGACWDKEAQLNNEGTGFKVNLIPHYWAMV